MFKIRDKWLALYLVISVVMVGLSTYMWTHNDYMERRDVPVTFIDRFTVQSCYKGHCKDEPKGLFKTEDGYVFSRYISDYMYRQMHLQEKFTLELRLFDIKQTQRDNLIWFFGPMIVYILTFVSLAVTIFRRYAMVEVKEKKDGIHW